MAFRAFGVHRVLLHVGCFTGGLLRSSIAWFVSLCAESSVSKVLLRVDVGFRAKGLGACDFLQHCRVAAIGTFYINMN